MAKSARRGPCSRSPLSVWRALFLREGDRLAAGRAAWLWILLEPIRYCRVLMVVFDAEKPCAVRKVTLRRFLHWLSHVQEPDPVHG